MLEIVKCEARGIGEILDFKEGYKRGQFKSEEIADRLSCIHQDCFAVMPDESFKKASNELAHENNPIIEAATQLAPTANPPLE